MNEPEVFVLADRALARAVARIAPEQWEMVLPASFTTRVRPEPPSLRTLVNYHAYDDAWVPDMLAGLTMDRRGRTDTTGTSSETTPWRASRRSRTGPAPRPRR
jgi:hypothetical protein